MSHIALFSSITMMAASVMPFYFAARLYRGRKLFFFLSLLLGLALVTHGVHHALEFTAMALWSLLIGFLSALFAVGFGFLYYASWRSSSGES